MDKTRCLLIAIYLLSLGAIIRIGDFLIYDGEAEMVSGLLIIASFIMFLRSFFIKKNN